MKERDLIKRSINRNMPNIDEVRNSCIAQNAGISNSNSNTRGGLGKKRHVSAVVFVVAILVAAAVLSNVLPSASTYLSDGKPVGIDDTIDRTNKDVPPSDPMESVYFNQMTDEPMSDSKLYFDPEKTYEEMLTLAQVWKYLGRDIRPKHLPNGMNAATAQSDEPHYRMIYHNDGSVAWDQFHFIYSESFEGYDPLHKTLRITVSKTTAKSDLLYVWSEDMNESKINGTEMKIGARKMSFGPYTDHQPAGYYDLFIAEFGFRGVDYQVVGENLSKEEFIETLSSMVE